MDYSLLVGIHDCSSSNGGRQALGTSPTGGAGDSSEPDAGSVGSATDYGAQPTPPDSPVPLVGAFSDLELKLEDEFYAISSRPGMLNAFFREGLKNKRNFHRNQTIFFKNVL